MRRERADTDCELSSTFSLVVLIHASSWSLSLTVASHGLLLLSFDRHVRLPLTLSSLLFRIHYLPAFHLSSFPPIRTQCCRFAADRFLLLNRASLITLQLKTQWNMKMTVIPIVISVLGTILKGLQKRLKE